MHYTHRSVIESIPSHIAVSVEFICKKGLQNWIQFLALVTGLVKKPCETSLVEPTPNAVLCDCRGGEALWNKEQ